jgi:hypothetical protein
VADTHVIVLPGDGLARVAGDAAIWTTLADAWIRDQP